MTPIFRFDGIYTPVITPYHPDGTVNRAALGQVIEHLIEHPAMLCRDANAAFRAGSGQRVQDRGHLDRFRPGAEY